jgi:hypothetical protein
VNLALWLAQGLLALAFIATGAMKLSLSHAALTQKLPWVASAPSWLPPLVGALELLGAAGLILPLALRIAPALTPVAAALLGAVMALAIGLHFTRSEPMLALPPLVLLGLCAFVALGR